jgi:hypothetical protein
MTSPPPHPAGFLFRNNVNQIRAEIVQRKAHPVTGFRATKISSTAALPVRSANFR